MYNGVFSEFSVQKQYFKFAGSSETAMEVSCIGTSEENLETKVITKMCRGVKEREVVKGSGSGTLKETLHMPYSVYNKLFGMNSDTLKTGVKGYGKVSTHPELTITQQVYDEDDELKYKAYPRCVCEVGPARKIENGAEEVAEIDVEIALLPDKYGFCMYEALDDGLDASLKASWMQSFDSDDVQVSGGDEDEDGDGAEGGES